MIIIIRLRRTVISDMLVLYFTCGRSPFGDNLKCKNIERAEQTTKLLAQGQVIPRYTALHRDYFFYLGQLLHGDLRI
jgi:hypothetical protein